jgi:hypothetical protein
MSDTLAGLARRVQAFAYTQETGVELSHLLDESREIGGDKCDALIEFALFPLVETPEGIAEDEYDAIMDDDEDNPGDEPGTVTVEIVPDDNGTPTAEEEAAIDADLDALADSVGDEDDDDDDDGLFGEGANVVMVI